MSTYLVALVVSEFVAVESDPALSSTPFRIWSRRSVANQTEYSRNIGPRVLEFLRQYFDIDFPLPKMDFSAVVDFAPGGMENWGLVIYTSVC